MSKPPLSSVGPGDSIPLDRVTWNAMIEAGRLASRGRPGFGAPDLPGGPTVPQALVLVQNDTGGDLDAFTVVKVSGTPPVSAVDYPHDVRRLPVLAGGTPAAATDAFAVLIEPVEDGELGRAAVLGVVPCSVHVNDASHGYAAPGTSTASLESATTGPAKILWKESSGTTRRAVVLLVGDTGGSGADGGCVGCGWLEDLRDTDCLLVSVLSAEGACACAADAEPVYLVSDDGDSWGSPGGGGSAGGGGGAGAVSS